MSKGNHNIPDHILKLITVTPEMTQASLDKLKYTIHPRPEGIKGKKGHLWCYICNDFKKFINKREHTGSYPRCETCSISTEDFYIKKWNGGWNK